MALFYMTGTSENSISANTIVLGIGAGAAQTSAGGPNVIIGTQAATALADTGISNVILGTSALLSATDGDNNTIIGSSAAGNLATGSNNTALGYIAGSSWDTSDSSNICIKNDGVSGDNNIIRIGTDGVGAGQQNLTYIAGTVQPARNLDLLVTSSTVGAITQNSATILHTFGTDNIFVGAAAGNLTTSGAGLNTCIGYNSGNALTTGSNNTLIGSNCGRLIDIGTHNAFIGNGGGSIITSGVRNSGLGYQPLVFLLTGHDNTAIGYQAGINYVAAESDNVLISNDGTLGDNNIIRIGTAGSGNGQQNKCFIAGITGVTPAGAGIQMAVIDTSGQLGSQAIPTAALIWSEVTGTTQAMAVGHGYLLNNAGTVTATLPSTAAVGDRVAVVGSGAGGWVLAQNAGQTIHFASANTTTGATGSLSSNSRYDSVELICNVTNTDWVVRSSVGSIIVT